MAKAIVTPPLVSERHHSRNPIYLLLLRRRRRRRRRRWRRDFCQKKEVFLLSFYVSYWTCYLISDKPTHSPTHLLVAIVVATASSRGAWPFFYCYFNPCLPMRKSQTVGEQEILSNGMSRQTPGGGMKRASSFRLSTLSILA